jgi:putative transposase
MGKGHFAVEQIAFAVRWAESGNAVAEIVRKLGISEQTFYPWKKRFAGRGIAELRRLRTLEQENRKLAQLLADLSLDKKMLQEVLSKNSKSFGAACSGAGGAGGVPGGCASGVPRPGFLLSDLPLPEQPQSAGRASRLTARPGDEPGPALLG